MTTTVELPPAADTEMRWHTDEEVAAYRARFAQLVTEDDTPVDNIFSERQQRLLTEPLYSTWRRMHQRPFVAMANVGLFYMLSQTPLVPDTLVSLDVRMPQDVWQKYHRSYVIWEDAYGGKPPDAVIEIVSNTKGEELGEKQRLYAQIGVIYYIVFDPERHLKQAKLQIFELKRRSYSPRKDHWLPELGLGVTLWPGVYEDVTGEWLRWCRKDGTLIATGAERAEHEAQRAEHEAQRAEHEAQRAERLAAKLRELGVDPDSV